MNSQGRKVRSPFPAPRRALPALGPVLLLSGSAPADDGQATSGQTSDRQISMVCHGWGGFLLTVDTRLYIHRASIAVPRATNNTDAWMLTAMSGPEGSLEQATPGAADRHWPPFPPLPRTALDPPPAPGASGLSKPSHALVEQLRSIDKRHIRRRYGLRKHWGRTCGGELGLSGKPAGPGSGGSLGWGPAER